MPGLWLSVALFLCCALLFSAGCTGPQQAEGVQANDTVRVNYTVSFTDGTKFQSNVNGTPLQFRVGSGEVIAGFDEAVIGMIPGMTKTVTISPENGYGPYRTELVNVMDTDQVRALNTDLQNAGNFKAVDYPGIGTVVLWQDKEGKIGYLRFTNITPETTTVDENHPLAGKDLVFEITLVDIVEKTS
ncbi:MAG: FKBP-type peptidyl-prolyl cis-trans isomerase [Methanoregulaceae archaeon]|nr:FKBP-type peptidyl-prolyl cis-trans isomerase [Methanoregulaceae archaeon]